jgi:hypothetical protein
MAKIVRVVGYVEGCVSALKCWLASDVSGGE